MSGPRQGFFDFGSRIALDRAAFVVGSANASAFALVERWPDWPQPAALLVGPAGSGKSHLAAIWAERSGASRLPGRELTVALVPEALRTGALVIDGADAVVDEAALFHLLNLAAAEGRALLLTARRPADDPGWRLPDLASRLRALPGARLGPPDEPLLAALLVKHLADRGHDATPDLVAYLCVRIERSYAAVAAVADALDRASLESHRRLTPLFAGEVLGRLGSGPSGGPA